MLLDDIIVARYAHGHPTLAVVADVADGSYAIALRPQDEDLRQAIDRAFGAELASGALARTLARWQIDGPRQAALAVAPDAGARRATPGRRRCRRASSRCSCRGRW